MSDSPNRKIRIVVRPSKVTTLLENTFILVEESRTLFLEYLVHLGVCLLERLEEHIFLICVADLGPAVLQGGGEVVVGIQLAVAIDTVRNELTHAAWIARDSVGENSWELVVREESIACEAALLTFGFPIAEWTLGVALFEVGARRWALYQDLLDEEVSDVAEESGLVSPYFGEGIGLQKETEEDNEGSGATHC